MFVISKDQLDKNLNANDLIATVNATKNAHDCGYYTVSCLLRAEMALVIKHGR